jgi:serine/threonine protein kinase
MKIFFLYFIYNFFSLKLGIFHGDLKPDNVLINDYGHLCLVDFGYSGNFGFYGQQGTERLVAPEVNANFNNLSWTDGYKSDMWSLGVCIYDLFDGEKCTYFYDLQWEPDQTRGADRVEEAINRGNFNIKQREILFKLLQLDPQKRPTIEEIKNCEYFKNFDWDVVKNRNKIIFKPTFIFDEYFRGESIVFVGSSRNSSDSASYVFEGKI